MVHFSVLGTLDENDIEKIAQSRPIYRCFSELLQFVLIGAAYDSISLFRRCDIAISGVGFSVITLEQPNGIPPNFAHAYNMLV